LLPDLYDDGGVSGGTLERPGLRCLLSDIDAGKVDLVVVYKVDRLTRSLADFAKLVERFDRARHEADDDTSAGKRWRLAAFLLLGPSHGERTRVAHVVPGGLDPAVGTLDVRDAKLVDIAAEGIADVAHVPRDGGRLNGFHDPSQGSSYALQTSSGRSA
jgi:hypothetical protein